jgi:hypothetical protein
MCQAETSTVGRLRLLSICQFRGSRHATLPRQSLGVKERAHQVDSGNAQHLMGIYKLGHTYARTLSLLFACW